MQYAFINQFNTNRYTHAIPKGVNLKKKLIKKKKYYPTLCSHNYSKCYQHYNPLHSELLMSKMERYSDQYKYISEISSSHELS